SLRLSYWSSLFHSCGTGMSFFKSVHKLPIAAGHLSHSGLPRGLLITPEHKRLPEVGPTHGEAGEAWYPRRRRPPLPPPFVPPPRMLQLTLPPPPRRAVATPFAQSSRRSSPSIFHTSGSTCASWSCSMLWTISRGRSSRS